MTVQTKSQRERERDSISERDGESCKIYGNNKGVQHEVPMAGKHYSLKHWIAKDKHKKKSSKSSGKQLSRKLSDLPDEF